jgi:hypothetical protein
MEIMLELTVATARVGHLIKKNGTTGIHRTYLRTPYETSRYKCGFL